MVNADKSSKFHNPHTAQAQIKARLRAHQESIYTRKKRSSTSTVLSFSSYPN